MLTPETTFRGRERELERLVAALDEGQAGRARAVGVAGDPGAGKSRLCQEFSQICKQRGVPVHEVRAQLYGHALPLQPILELFRVHFFGIGAGDDPARARARIDDCFAPVTAAAADLHLLHEFFGVAAANAPDLELGPRARHARLLALVRELMRHQRSVERVIVIEDLHWLDEASEEFVTALVDATHGTRTLLLLNYRGGYRAPWAGTGSFDQVELDELPPADMDALVAELLAPITALPDICRLVCRRAAGNPFFAEELVRTLAESNVISRDTGLPAGGLEDVERALPATIEAVIGARLDRIGEPEKTLLQMCSIIGKEIPLVVLEHVASPIANQIQIGLEGLCQAGLILPQPAEGGRRFAFRHPLIQEVAYGTQLKVRRGQVHAAVAAAMELYYAEQIDEYAALVGYHFEQAGELLRAARYIARAADWVGSSNSAPAIRHWRKVSELLERVPRSPDVDRLRVTAGGKIALLGWRQGMSLEQVKPLIEDALALANEVDDRLVPWLLTIEGRMVVASGGAADAYVDCVRKALLYIDIDRDPGRVAVAHAFLSQAYSWAGLLREALAANDVAQAKLAHVDAFDRDFIGFSIEQWVLSVRAKVLSRMNRDAEARACLQAIRDLEATTVDPPVPGMAALGFVELAWTLEDAALASAHEEELLHVASKHDMPYLTAFMHGHAAMAKVLAGRHADALALFTGALALLRRTGAAREYETELLASLAECHLRMGDWPSAHALATEAVALSRERGTRIAECRALIIRAAAAHSCGEPAGDDLQRAQELVAITGAIACRAALDRALATVSAARAT